MVSKIGKNKLNQQILQKLYLKNYCFQLKKKVNLFNLAETFFGFSSKRIDAVSLTLRKHAQKLLG